MVTVIQLLPEPFTSQKQMEFDDDANDCDDDEIMTVMMTAMAEAMIRGQAQVKFRQVGSHTGLKGFELC